MHSDGSDHDVDHERPDVPRPLTRRRALGRAGAALAGGAVAGCAAGVGATAQHGDAPVTRAELVRRGHGGHGEFGTWQIIYSVPVARRAVAITIDDGPDPAYTPRCLEILDQFGVGATFNMMGSNVTRHPNLARSVRDAGHEVGNHGMTHLDLALADLTTVTEEITGGSAAIEAATGQCPTMFRPPRGDLNGAMVRVASETGHHLLMWTTSATMDLDESNEDFLERVVTSAAPGHIINLHDGIGRGTFLPKRDFSRKLAEQRRRELEALPDLLSRLIDDGFSLVSVSELLALRETRSAVGRSVGG